MDNWNKAFTVGQILTFLVFARATVARGAAGQGRTVADSIDPTIKEAMQETGLTPEAVDHYMQVLGEPQVFRGSTPGFEGNNPGLGLSPASIDPAVATAFATEAATTSGSTGTVYYGPMRAFADTIGVGNWLRTAEAEVAVPVTPAQFSTMAPRSITAAQARTILRNMGREIPEQIYGKDGLRSVVEGLKEQRMTPEEVQQFQSEAAALE